MKRRYVTIDVFTDRMFGGNPLAVVLDAAGLSTSQMQAIAISERSSLAGDRGCESCSFQRRVRCRHRLRQFYLGPLWGCYLGGCRSFYSARQSCLSVLLL